MIADAKQKLLGKGALEVWPVAPASARSPDAALRAAGLEPAGERSSRLSRGTCLCARRTAARGGHCGRAQMSCGRAQSTMFTQNASTSAKPSQSLSKVIHSSPHTITRPPISVWWAMPAFLSW